MLDQVMGMYMYVWILEQLARDCHVLVTVSHMTQSLLLILKLLSIIVCIVSVAALIALILELYGVPDSTISNPAGAGSGFGEN